MVRAALSPVVLAASLCGLLSVALPASAQEPPTPPRAPQEGFETRVRALEERVVDLKERVHRSKARLLLLQESALGGSLSTGARAVLVHRNEMSAAFALESVAYALDGAPIFTRTEDAELAGREEFEVFNGRIVPGQHQLDVRLVYRGNGHGVFSYLEGYRFKLQYTCTFNAEPGKTATVRIVGHEKGGLTADLEDRPSVDCRVEVARDGARPALPVGDAAAGRAPRDTAPAPPAPVDVRPAS